MIVSNKCEVILIDGYCNLTIEDAEEILKDLPNAIKLAKDYKISELKRKKQILEEEINSLEGK